MEAEGQRLSQGEVWDWKAAQLCPVSGPLPSTLSQTCPANGSPAQSSNILPHALQPLSEKGGCSARLIPLASQLDSPQPNTGQDLDCQAPGLPAWLAKFSPSDFSLPHLRAAPGEAQQTWGQTEAPKSLPPSLSLVQAHSCQAAPRWQPTLPSCLPSHQ